MSSTAIREALARLVACDNLIRRIYELSHKDRRTPAEALELSTKTAEWQKLNDGLWAAARAALAAQAGSKTP